MSKQDLVFKLRRNKLVRVCYLPVALVKRFIQSVKFPRSEDGKFMASLKDSHKGERCFIIGNGPSLTAEDLSRLKDEFCFATNRIYYMFDKTEWRPSMYVSFDLDVIAKEVEMVSGVDCDTRLFNINAKKYFPKNDSRNHYFFLKGKFKIDRNGTGQTTVNEDLSKFMTLTDNVTGVCLQLAFYMGFSEIYLIGVDHSYGSKSGDGNKQNYFAGMKGSIPPSFNLEATNKSYKTLCDYAKSKGIKVFNATRGGKLEIFERADFDSVAGG
ncbi:MAG: DUF115 domain-containing protein [Clostridia bacterium]|nr:DUF115 domain-containing protein [Clostridia bacterium]